MAIVLSKRSETRLAMNADKTTVSTNKALTEY